MKYSRGAAFGAQAVDKKRAACKQAARFKMWYNKLTLTRKFKFTVCFYKYSP